MTTRASLALVIAAALLPIALLPLLVRPELGLASITAIVAVLLAWMSPAYPLGLRFGGDLVGLTGVQVPDNAIAGLAFAWTAIAIVFALLRGRSLAFMDSRLAGLAFLTVLLATIMVARLDASPAREYGTIKIQLFWTGNLVLLLAGMLAGKRDSDVQALLAIVLVVALAAASVVLVGLLVGADPMVAERYAVTPDTNPIWLGRLTGMGLLIAVFFVIHADGARQFLALGAVPVLAVAFLASGSRGPVLGLLLGFGVLIGSLLALERPVWRRLPLVLTAIVLAAVVVSQFAPSDAVQRAASVLLGEETLQDSSNGRLEIWEHALRAFLDHPWVGVGTGGFQAIDPVAVYPHNLLLETAVEWGLAGLLALVAAIGLGVAVLGRALRWGSGQSLALAVAVFALLAAALTNAMFSGDIVANEDVWLVLGLAAGLGSRVPRPDGQVLTRRNGGA